MLYLYNDQDCVGSSTYLLNRVLKRPLIRPNIPLFLTSMGESSTQLSNRSHPDSCHASTLIKIFTRECLQKLNLHSSTWLPLFSMKPALKLQVQLGVSFICKR